jgi:hypothetical protein
MSSFAETPLLSAVLSVLLIHPSMGAAAVDSLSSIAVMDPKLGVPLLLAIMFYSNIFTSNDIICHDMLVSPPFCSAVSICNINIYFFLNNCVSNFQVSQLEKSIPDFKKMNLELFFSETSPTVLKVMEDFHVKIITYEHM